MLIKVSNGNLSGGRPCWLAVFPLPTHLPTISLFYLLILKLQLPYPNKFNFPQKLLPLLSNPVKQLLSPNNNWHPSSSSYILKSQNIIFQKALQLRFPNSNLHPLQSRNHFCLLNTVLPPCLTFLVLKLQTFVNSLPSTISLNPFPQQLSSPLTFAISEV